MLSGIGALAQASTPQAVEVHAHGSLERREKKPSKPSMPSLMEDEDKADDKAEKEGSLGARQLIRSEHVHARDGPSTQAGVDESPAGMADAIQGTMKSGVELGACKNFAKVGLQDAAINCPPPLKMVGCNCMDKEGEQTGGCGTKFNPEETCNAFTRAGANVSAIVRCCLMDRAMNFSIRTSTVASGPADGNGVNAQCHAGESLLGCTCLPGDAPNFGCKHNLIVGYEQQAWMVHGLAADTNTICTATNLGGHDAGVKSQALCAIIPNSSSWEMVKNNEHTVDVSTNLSCSRPELTMVSCSCGSSAGQCAGGKVINNKCECSGHRCYATARCAYMPPPPRPCQWGVWGEWSDCSVSCGDGNGTRSRVREIGVLATFGGPNCTGAFENLAHCSGSASSAECNQLRLPPPKKGGYGIIIILFFCMCCCCCGGGAITFTYVQNRNEPAEDKMGEYGGEGEYGEGEGEGGGGGYGYGEGAGGPPPPPMDFSGEAAGGPPMVVPDAGAPPAAPPPGAM